MTKLKLIILRMLPPSLRFIVKLKETVLKYEMPIIEANEKFKKVSPKKTNH